jgi:RNA polymerase sigma-70 factor (ECF subfamily)
VRAGAAGASFDAIESRARTGARSGEVAPRSDETSSLKGAIGSLPAHLREVVVLRELEGLSIEALAEVMGVPSTTVAFWLSRARLALAAVLFARAPRDVRF